MHIVDLVGAIGLDAVHERASQDIRRDAVEEEITDDIGHVIHAVVAGGPAACGAFVSGAAGGGADVSGARDGGVAGS